VYCLSSKEGPWAWFFTECQDWLLAEGCLHPTDSCLHLEVREIHKWPILDHQWVAYILEILEEQANQI